MIDLKAKTTKTPETELVVGHGYAPMVKIVRNMANGEALNEKRLSPELKLVLCCKLSGHSSFMELTTVHMLYTLIRRSPSANGV